MNEQQEGLLESYDAINNLDMKDSDILAIIDKRLTDSKAHWADAKGFNLESIRKENRDLWLGNHLKLDEFYNFNVPYIDNRIFTSTETVVATVNSRVPQPESFPAQQTMTSRKIAQDLEKGLFAYAENNYVNEAFKYATRHLILYRLGMLKLRWDEFAGKNGEIITEYVLPQDLIIDKDAKPGQNPRVIGQYLKDSIENLIAKFPAKKEEIYKHFGIKRGVATQLASEVGYMEVWFTYTDESGRPREGVCWKIDKLVLGKIKNPNWNYDDDHDKEYNKNFLRMPLKPYIPMNYLNLGESYIDDTTVVEQAKSLQHTLNKRGRQIVENADQANGSLAISTKALSVEDAQELTGDPTEKIMLDTDDVRTAINRIAPDILPNYVIEDKYDARNEIDNIFATHNVTRGEQSSNGTLGQDVLQKNQDMGRQDEIVRAIDACADRYYKYLVQMMKVYYTEDHWFTLVGDTGKFVKVVLNSDKIEDGCDVRVKAGTTLPIDKQAMRATALELAGAGMIDPLTLFEDLGLPNATRRYERLIQYNQDPTSLLDVVKGETVDDEAFMDIEILNRGEKADPRNEVTPEHLDYHGQYMKSGEFRELKDKIKMLHREHVALEIEEMRRTLLLEETQLPTEEETIAGNEMVNQMNEQDMNAQPPIPGAPGPDGQVNQPADPNLQAPQPEDPSLQKGKVSGVNKQVQDASQNNQPVV